MFKPTLIPSVFKTTRYSVINSTTVSDQYWALADTQSLMLEVKRSHQCIPINKTIE